MFVYCVTGVKQTDGHGGQKNEFFTFEVPVNQKITTLELVTDLLLTEMTKIVLEGIQQLLDIEYEHLAKFSSYTKEQYIKGVIDQYKFVAFSFLREE